MGTRIYYDLKLHHLTVQWRINQLGQFLIMWFWDAGFLAREIAGFLVEIDYKKELKLRIESVWVLEQNKTKQNKYYTNTNQKTFNIFDTW